MEQSVNNQNYEELEEIPNAETIEAIKETREIVAAWLKRKQEEQSA